MPNSTAAQSQALACSYILKQAGYHGLVHGFKTAMKFAPSEIVVKDSVLTTAVAGGRALVRADYTPLITQTVTMAFTANKAAIEKMASIRGAGDVCVSLQDGRYHIRGDHTGSSLEAIAVPGPNALKLTAITWIGTEVKGYDPKDLKGFIGKRNGAVHLAVYDGQLEQIGLEMRGTYTFTADMAAQLSSRRPDTVLISQVAFRYFGKKQSLHVGQFNGQYILKVTNSLDIGVDLVVFEQLEVVSTSGAVSA